MAGDPILLLQGVQAQYGQTPVLFGVDLQLEAGQLGVILGRNGVGKTTLARTIMGLVPKISGTIMFQGHDLTKLPAHRISSTGISYVPQGRGIFTALTVEENLRLGLMMKSPNERQIPGHIFDYFPILRERLHQKAGTLSGGQQQMLAIARALISSPSLLILDEPTEGIQPSIVQEVFRLLELINRERMLTILLVEQNVELALSIGSRVFILEKGSVVLDGTPADVSQAVIKRYLAV